MVNFLFVDKRKLFAMKLSFVEFNLVFYTADRSAWLVLNQPRQRDFWRHLRYILYSMIKKVRFLKGIFVFIKVSWTFCTFWHRRERKPQNVHLTLIFCYVLNRFNLLERIHDPVCVTRIALTYWLTYRLLNNNFQEIKLFICHSSFITLTQKTTMRLQIVRFLETFRRALSWIGHLH